MRRRQRRITSTDDYGRKLKPTAKKTRKTRQKTKKHLKAALLALEMLAIIPTMIAGSVLTNVITQVSAAYCAYKSGWFSDLGQFRDCIVDIWLPTEFYTLGMMGKGYADVKIGEKMIQIGTKVDDKTIVKIGKSLIKTGSRLVRYSTIGSLVVGA